MGRKVALAAVAEGCWVFQVCWRDKVPQVKDWPNVATSDPEVVRRWPPGGYNVGIAAGPSNLVLVDIDGPAAMENFERVRDSRPLPATRTVSTARACGIHLWFTALPDLVVRNTTGKADRGIAPGVDTRGAGGFGICPGSVIDQRAYSKPVVLQNGGEYRIVDPRPPVPIPRWLAEAARRRPHQDIPAVPTQPVAAPTAYGEAALQGEAGQLRRMAPDSGRNHQLNLSAYKLGRLVPDGILSAETIVTVLMQAARDCQLVADDGEAACLATIRSGLEAGMTNPRRSAVTAR
jgi:Bifunctional DNA primase/polymerase, N-terminal